MAQVRGLFTFNGVLHAVIGDALVSVDSTGAQTSLATIGSAGGPVDMVQTLTQLVIGDGAQLYVWDGAAKTTISDYVVGDSLAFVDQRVLFPLRGSQKFQWTALGDARQIDPLDFASAEGSPDRVVAIVSNLRELLILGENTGEVWLSVGGLDAFQRSPSEFLQVGCAAARSALLVGDTPVWLGRDADGQAQVYAGRGQRVSTRAIEERFEGIDIANARAYTYSDGGSRFYCLNVQNVDTTLCFDLTFKQWHERAELVAGAYAPWRPTCHAFAYGKHYFGAADGKIYRLDASAHDFAGDVKVRDRIAPVISRPDTTRMRFSRFDLVSERGHDGTVMLRFSDDNGATWSSWRTDSAGAVGEYRERVRFNRLGSARDRVFQVRMTDAVPFNPVAANVEVE
jgi:hypothetical protein